MSDRKEIRKDIKCDYELYWYDEPIDNVIEYFNDLKNKQGATHITIGGDGNDVWVSSKSIKLESDEEYNARLVKEESLRLAEIERRQKEELAFYEILKAKFEKQ